MTLLVASPATPVQCRSGTRYTPNNAGVISVPGGPDLLDCLAAGYSFVGLSSGAAGALSPSTDAITAFAGGGQGSAVQLTSVVNRVTTVGTAADSVKLPAAVPGLEVTVINAAAANAMNVFPATGEVINALAANTAISVAANKAISFFCAVAGVWNSQLTA